MLIACQAFIAYIAMIARLALLKAEGNKSSVQDLERKIRLCKVLHNLFANEKIHSGQYHLEANCHLDSLLYCVHPELHSQSASVTL